MSESEVINSLADKLGAANLSADETNLLVALVERNDAEVEGFFDKSSPKIGHFNIGMPPRFEPSDRDKWIDVLSTDWVVQAPKK